VAKLIYAEDLTKCLLKYSHFLVLPVDPLAYCTVFKNKILKFQRLIMFRLWQLPKKCVMISNDPSGVGL